MKKFKFLALVAFFGAMSTNALAEDKDTYVSKDGHIFKYSTAVKDGKVDGTFAGVGNEKTTVTIPASVAITDPKTEKTYTVNITGVESNWWTENKTSGAVAVDGKVTELNINITNFSKELTNDAYSGLKKLATLKITDATAADKAKTKTLPAINTTVTSLDIEATHISAIAENAFMGKALASVKLPAALVTIGAGAFQNCADLAGTIKIPATVTTIGKKAFEKSAKVDIDLSEAAALTEIGIGAFAESGITVANLNKSVKLKFIGNDAFKDCKKLAKLQMSGIAKGKLTTIGSDAFNGTAITSANVPATVTTIGVAAFANCKELTQVSAMAGLTAIPNYLFQNCEKLARVTISEDVATIGQNAFEGCKALATVNFKTDDESNLTSIGQNAFKNCETLTSIDLSGTKITTLNGNDKAQFIGCKSLKEIKLPETLETLGASIFADAVIEDLDLSNTQITVLNAIFGKYPTAKKPYASLKTIKLPETLASFQDYSTWENGVFSYCTSLEEITIPVAFKTADAVPAYAFYYCTSLKKVNYSPVEKITPAVFNENAFLGCTPFVHIVTNTYYTTDKIAPKNTTFGDAESDKVTTVKDNGSSGKFFAKLCPLSNVTIDVNDAKVYSIYVDGGVAYFQSLLQRDGKYIVEAGKHVIIKTDEAKTVNLTPYTGKKTSVTVDEIFTLNADTPTSKVQDNTAGAKYSDGKTDVTFSASNYIYRLTNNASTGGFGFTYYSGATMKAGQFFILSTKKPAAGRLNVVWLDENGNVEDETTAISAIENVETETGSIFNLAGQKVDANYKGVVIKNGKKMIQK